MENETAFILFSFLLLSCFIAQSSAFMKQTEALSRFGKYKFNTQIDKSLFNASELLFDVAELVQYSQTGLKEKDRIERLPGQPEVKFKQYGGYVTVDQKNGRALYYYFAEAVHHSEKKLPLLLWLNGGPGCSSFGYGAMQELGPFRVQSDGKTLYKNDFAWNQVANVLFLESPAGVGFSYSNTTNDTVTGGDSTTSIDNYLFLVKWLERFPDYKTRGFYIAGESYAGHYVPQLANIILHQNKKAKKIIINLKGVIIGNAVMNDKTDFNGMYEYFGSHALISEDTANQIKKYCDFSPNATEESDKCIEAASEADETFDIINIYNIYAPSCFNHNLTDKPKKTSIFNFDPCTDIYVKAYLNRPDVQKALHANVTNIPYDWEPCSDLLMKWTDSPYTILPLLKELIDNRLRIWIFSGDVDGRVPVTSTQLSINEMKLDINTTWHPWYLLKEVAGYATHYDGLTFATLRGSGHQAPSYKPSSALSLIKNFLVGKKL